MKIPKKFKLFGTTIDVAFNDKQMNKEILLGESQVTRLSIILAKTSKGKALKDDVILDTYYHEKVHIILDTMGEHKLSRNEKFVEVFSGLLRQSDETAEF